jgi:hypothetical protein
MTRFIHALSGIVLLALLFNIGIVSAADFEEKQADLNVSKIVSSTGPYEIDDEVTWAITLRNNGPGNATNITLQEDSSHLYGLKNVTAVAGPGVYNTTTNIWRIDELLNGSYATLTLKTTFNTSGNKTNKVNITAFDGTDPVLTDNHAEATVEINASEIIPPLGSQADLNVSKIVSSTGPYEIDDEVTWAITLWNNGPGNATNITLQEDSSHLYGLKNVTALPGPGVYNTTTHVWSIDELLNGSYATLTLKTTFNTSGNKTNKVNITAFDGTDPVLTDNHAEAMVQYNTSQTINLDTPSHADLVIRPNTLNLKSKGIFTVYVSLYSFSHMPWKDDNFKARIDYANSSLTCSGAEMVRASVSNKDSGTLIAKFHRNDLENITSGDGVKINCSGTLVVNNNTINVEGSDTIRVIGEKNELDKILSRLWKFLGLSKEDVEITEDENGNINLTISLNPEDFKKFSQIKKSLKTKENATDPGNESAFKNENKNVKEQSEKNNGSNKQIKSQNKENNADDNKGKGNNKEDKGNNSANARDDDSPGKSNGKKNK